MCRVSSWPWSLADINLAIVIIIIITTKIDIIIFLVCLGVPLVNWSLADINLAIVSIITIIIITDITKVDIII